MNWFASPFSVIVIVIYPQSVYHYDSDESFFFLEVISLP